jgi:5-methyltetrahydrofolate--homocysteine methyltransferase
MNPLDKKMMANIITTETLLGRDPFCENYMNAYRDGMFEF